MSLLLAVVVGVWAQDGDSCQLVKVAAEDRGNARCFNEPECEQVCDIVNTKVSTV